MTSTLRSIFGLAKALSWALLFFAPLLTANTGKQMVNAKLAKQMKIYKPELVQLGDRVHAVFGYDASNYGYIEGDDGIIVVDSGWFPGQAKRSIADYREQVPDKPIAAIIYTHLHLDHTGGAISIMEGQSGDIPVYGPTGWQQWVDDSFSNLGAAMYRRIFAQFGLVLPHGEEGTVGIGAGPPPKVEGEARLSFPPTIDIDEPTELTIAGVRLQIIPQEGDLPEHLYVWLPDDKVLFVGDVMLHSAFPAVETVRFEMGRDPRMLNVSLDKVLELDPEFVVPGHGRLLIGKDDITDVALANRDTIEFLIDQVDRHYLNGYSADQIIDRLELPTKLKNHPDLQPFYHRVEWMIKMMYLKRAGFVGETMDYLTLTQSEESKRLVPLLGGVKAVHKQAQEALAAGEPRWAARLATYAMEVDHNDQIAISIRQSAFMQIARTTISANERNYLLTFIREENGELDWKKILSGASYKAMSNQSTDTVLHMMKSRFIAENAGGVEGSIEVIIEGEQPRFMRVRNNVLTFSDEANTKPIGSFTMSRDTLDRLGANLLSWSEALEQRDIKLKRGKDAVRQILKLLE